MSFPADNAATFPTSITKAIVPELSSPKGNLGEGEWDRIDALEHDSRLKLKSAPDLEQVTFELKFDDKQIIIAFQDAGKEVVTIAIDKKLLKSAVADYALTIQAYYAAIRTGTPPQIQRYDMARRDIHNAGAEKLRSLLRPKGAELGLNAARNVFYLIANRLG